MHNPQSAKSYPSSLQLQPPNSNIQRVESRSNFHSHFNGTRDCKSSKFVRLVQIGVYPLELNCLLIYLNVIKT